MNDTRFHVESRRAKFAADNGHGFNFTCRTISNSSDSIGNTCVFFFLFSAIGDLGEGERAEMHGGAVMGN